MDGKVSNLIKYQDIQSMKKKVNRTGLHGLKNGINQPQFKNNTVGLNSAAKPPMSGKLQKRNQTKNNTMENKFGLAKLN